MHFDSHANRLCLTPAWYALIEDYRTIVCESLDTIVTRSERHAGGTLIDTKLDLVGGGEAAPADLIRGRGTVYGWIQARGLESLGRHYQWLAQSENAREAALAERALTLLRGVLVRLEAIRGRRGRLTFMMDTEGAPLRVTERGVEPDDSPPPAGATLTDIFYAKGLAEAAVAMGDDQRLREADALFRMIVADIESGRFVFDQMALDPANPIRPVPGRHTHAPWMLSIGAATRLALLTGDAWHTEVGRRFADYLLERHVANDDFGPVKRGDFWEFLDDTGGPYVRDGVLWSDPGHGIEAAGLALRHMRLTCGAAPGVAQRWAEVVTRNFRNGYLGTGICKAFDLNGRNPINHETPWWSLPETLRAAAEAMAISDERAKAEFAEILALASNTFCERYLRPEQGMLAVQCLDASGEPVCTIPAVPDIDPGYHTNLCLMEVVDMLESATGKYD